MLLDFHSKLSKGMPVNVVCLVPSLSETLIDCGIAVSGVTRFCIHPEDKVQSIIKIGGTKNPDVEKIRSLNPDLIIAVREENRKEDIEVLAESFPVIIGDISDQASIVYFLIELNKLFYNEKLALLIEQLSGIKFPRLTQQKPALYLIWHNPIMSIGSDTYIHNVLNMVGFSSVSSSYLRYPSLSTEEARNLHPEYILLSSEPYKFKEKHISIYTDLFPQSKVILVEGEMFSWYGSRQLLAPGYFEKLFQFLKLPYTY